MSTKRELTEKQRKLAAAAVFAVFILFTALVCVFIGIPMVKFVSEPEKFRLWVDSFEIWGWLIYVGMVFIQVFVAIIPGEPLEIVGGYAFGALEGTVLCLAGAALGSILVFALVRKFGMKLVEVFFPPEKIHSLKFLQRSARRDFLFLIIFMIPGTPKDLLCYFAGITDIRFGTWLLICSFGRLPSIVTSTIGGNALGVQNYLFAVIAFVVALAVSAAGMLVYQRICKRGHRTGRNGSDTQPRK